MKFFGIIVAATALFASGISALPLGNLGEIHPRTPSDYSINKVFANWMNDPKTQRRLANHCNTRGGWEGWAQAEIEDELRRAFTIPHTIREVTSVYKGKEFADLVLPLRPRNNGMILELKCENAYGQKGSQDQSPCTCRHCQAVRCQTRVQRLHFCSPCHSLYTRGRPLSHKNRHEAYPGG